MSSGREFIGPQVVMSGWFPASQTMPQKVTLVPTLLKESPKKYIHGQRNRKLIERLLSCTGENRNQLK
jgi:hypothetical protein